MGDQRGSLWRRWDPHLHAPGTILNDGFGGPDVFDRYSELIEAAEPPLEAIGVTDYFTTRSYETVLAARQEGRLPNVRLLFPNIEMRLSIETRRSKGVNLHLLVSPDDPDHVVQLKRFLRRLDFEYKGDKYSCTDEDLTSLGRSYDPTVTDDAAALRVGVNQFKVDFRQLRTEYEDSEWMQANSLVAVAGGSADGTSGLQSEDAGFAATRKEIEETFGCYVVDQGTMAEMTPWMTNGECRHRTGMHLWQDLVYTQVCDPRSLEPVAYGEEGTPVYTHLERTSQPMIRLLSGDLTRWVDEPCPCGRTYPRLPAGIYGRIDDMFIVRGENIYPAAIEETLRGIAGFGGEFRVIISRREQMDDLLVRVEYAASHAGADARRALAIEMERRLQARLGVRARLDLVPEGSLPRTEFKARRVVDDRDLYRRVGGS
jgi:hypothetical protein